MIDSQHDCILGYTFEGPFKVDLPENILQDILVDSSRLSASPLIFEVWNGKFRKIVGVREFSAPDSQIGLEHSLAKQLHLEIGDPVQLRSIELPKGEQITVKVVQSSADNSIDWKSLLESWIPKNYTALTVDDVIELNYLGHDVKLAVTALKPSTSKSVCVIDTDMELIVESDVKINASSDSEALQPTSIELNKPLDLAQPALLTVNIPPNTKTVFVSCSELAYIGPEHATSESSFVCVADSQPVEIPLDILGRTFAIKASGTLSVTTPVHDAGELSGEHNGERNDDYQECGFCGKKNIPRQSFILHSSFCSRNSSQCTQCGRKFGNTKTVPENHRKLHELEAGLSSTCECGTFTASSAKELALHRALACSLTLHICRFCHLLVHRGETSAVDQVLGFSGHEAQCGNRTADCPECSKPVILRSLSAHLAEHEEARRQRKPPRLCANQNCSNPLFQSAPFELCTQCFGPLSVQGSNNDFEQLRRRIERRYVLQMTSGCGKSWCINEYCAMNKKRTPAEAFATTKSILNNESGKHWFCVDDKQTKKAMYVQIENGYAREWRGLAINQCNTESEAQLWLQKNAPPLSVS